MLLWSWFVQEAYGGAGRVPAGGSAGGQARLPASFQQVGAHFKIENTKKDITQALGMISYFTVQSIDSDDSKICNSFLTKKKLILKVQKRE